MTRVFSENFEGGGYENTWWGETTDSGCTIDEDASPPAGAPGSWGTQCLHCVNTITNGDAYNQNGIPGNETLIYLRFGFYLDSEDLSQTGIQDLFFGWDDSFNNAFAISLNQYNEIILRMFGDTEVTESASYTNQTFHLYEAKLDFGGGTYEVKLDEVSQGSGSLPANPVAHFRYFSFGLMFDQTNAVDIYYDLLAFDDADWIGAEPTGTDPISTTMRLALGLW